MVVYFDKVNLVSFIKSSKDNRFDDCNKMLKNHCQIVFTFKKDSLDEESDDNETIKTWLSTCSEDFNSSWRWADSVFPPRPLASNTINSFGKQHLQSVYLIDDEKKTLLKNKGLLLTAETGKELDLLSQLWFDDLQYQKNCFDEINTWGDLKQWLTPCSDIIIVDQFLALHEDKLEHNLLPLLETLCNYANNSKVNIVVYSLPEDPETHVSPNWDDLVRRIQQRVARTTTLKPNVTVVTATKHILDEHDRSIYTNYRLLASGDSWNYFDDSWNKVTRGRYLNVFSLVSRNNSRTADKLISDLQRVYDRALIMNRNLIHKYSHSKSNFINLHD